jgi:hypothetical protein
MDIKAAIDSNATVVNAGGIYYLKFPYTNSVGVTTEILFVQVPIKHSEPSASDRKALLEAVTVQGGMGQWMQKSDGSVWLLPTE